MRILASLAATCLLTLCALEADASVVDFTGTISSGGGGTAVLGTITPPTSRDFSLLVNFTDSVTSPATITGGTFNVFSPLQPFTVTGGNILVTDNGPNDSTTFVVNVASGATTGLLTFTFDRDAITNSQVNQGNVNALALGNTANFTAIFNLGAGGVYSGHITGVPEPSSCLALLGLVGGGAWRWRRTRQQRNAV